MFWILFWKSDSENHENNQIEKKKRISKYISVRTGFIVSVKFRFCNLVSLTKTNQFFPGHLFKSDVLWKPKPKFGAGFYPANFLLLYRIELSHCCEWDSNPQHIDWWSFFGKQPKTSKSSCIEKHNTLSRKVRYNGAIQKHATGLVWYCKSKFPLMIFSL